MAAWLSEFADHPDAPTIYALAVRRGPRGVETPQPSVMARHESYFTDRAVTSTWNQALASWRRGDYQGAAQLFEVVGSSTSETASGWTRSAGAFWAARANLLAGSPDRYLVWLRAAATQDHTFYGLLALRTLGATPYRSWNAAEWTSSRRALMRDSAGGRRALALLQVGVVQAAERELISIAVNNDNDAIVAALALAERAHLPAAALRMGYSILDRMGPEGRRRIEGLDNALYPVPRWRPQEGFVVDPALVWAFMRQESGFNPRARSRAGAMGLMQLMPGTARFVVRDFLPGREGTPPFQPDFNLSMGQQYLKHLTEVGVIGDNLLMIAAGYNGGPGNVARWGAGDDALLWVASVPLDETRGFIEVVTANYWTYQMRLGQPLTSLEELAAHRWPQYRPGGQRAAAN
jgi:soluble lytic murein transglycosylase